MLFVFFCLPLELFILLLINPRTFFESFFLRNDTFLKRIDILAVFVNSLVVLFVLFRLPLKLFILLLIDPGMFFDGFTLCNDTFLQRIDILAVLIEPAVVFGVFFGLPLNLRILLFFRFQSFPQKPVLLGLAVAKTPKALFMGLDGCLYGLLDIGQSFLFFLDVQLRFQLCHDGKQLLAGHLSDFFFRRIFHPHFNFMDDRARFCHVLNAKPEEIPHALGDLFLVFIKQPDCLRLIALRNGHGAQRILQRFYRLFLVIDFPKS